MQSAHCPFLARLMKDVCHSDEASQQLVEECVWEVTRALVRQPVKNEVAAVLCLLMHAAKRFARWPSVVRLCLSCLCALEPLAALSAGNCAALVDMLAAHGDASCVLPALATLSARAAAVRSVAVQVPALLRLRTRDPAVHACIASVVANVAAALPMGMHFKVVKFVEGAIDAEPQQRMRMLAAVACLETASKTTIGQCLRHIGWLVLKTGGPCMATQCKVYATACAAMYAILEAHPRFPDTATLGSCLQVVACFVAADMDMVEYCYRRLARCAVAGRGIDYADAVEIVAGIAPKAAVAFMACGCLDLLALLERVDADVRFLRNKTGAPFAQQLHLATLFAHGAVWFVPPEVRCVADQMVAPIFQDEAPRRPYSVDLSNWLPVVDPVFLVQRVLDVGITCVLCRTCISYGQYGLRACCGCPFHVYCLVARASMPVEALCAHAAIV